MPIYEYACTSCGERVEAKQGFDDPPLDTCEICGGKLRKLYSPVGIVFKGSGFYANDSRSKRSESRSSSEAGSSDDASSGGSAKKDAGAKDGGGKGKKESA